MIESNDLEKNIETLLNASIPDNMSEPELDISPLLREVRRQRLSRPRVGVPYGYKALYLSVLVFLGFAVFSGNELLLMGLRLLLIANIAASPLAAYALVKYRRMVKHAYE